MPLIIIGGNFFIDTAVVPCFIDLFMLKQKLCTTVNLVPLVER